MGRVAAGRYLEILLEEKKLSVPTAAERLGISAKTVGRWLSGDVAAPVDGFLELVALAGGSVVQVDHLLRDKQATPADGIRIAGEWLSHDQAARLRVLAAQIRSEAELETLISLWKQRQGHTTTDTASAVAPERS